MDRFGRVFGFLVSFPGVFCWYFPNEKTAVWSTNGVSMFDSILLFSSGHCVADIWLFSDNRNIWFVASLAFHYVSSNLFFFFFFNDYQTRKSCSKLLFRESVRFRSYFLSILPLVSMAINWDSRSSGDGHFSLFFLFFFRPSTFCRTLQRPIATVSFVAPTNSPAKGKQCAAFYQRPRQKRQLIQLKTKQKKNNSSTSWAAQKKTRSETR